MRHVRITIAQINTIVGDLKGNTQKILYCIDQVRNKQVDIIIFPELSVTGYPPEDLLLKPHFVERSLECLDRICRNTKDIIAIVGFVDRKKSSIYNSAAVMVNRRIVYIYHKMNLPNYGVFDEKRYFSPGEENIVLRTGGVKFAVNICEDIWVKENIVSTCLLSSINFLINISASPYHMGKVKERQEIIARKARRHKIPIVYCNLIGGQDELIFDGRSMVCNANGRCMSEAKAFEEDLLSIDLPVKTIKPSLKKAIPKIRDFDYKIKTKKSTLPRYRSKKMSDIEEVYSALVLGIRDYVRKNNFNKVVLGLSGGIDSAVSACIAVDALGAANVLALAMPSRYSSKATQDDAERLSKSLGIRLARVPIDSIFNAYISILSNHFAGMDLDITEENIQARIRGNILMAFSNKFGYLVLNTGNKSETSVGYCTLYGDMAGGFAAIKDVPKKLVYKLARFINSRHGDVIPSGILERAPSAELRPNQKDQDSLPPYDLLDEVIDLYIEKDTSFHSIVRKLGHKQVVKKILKMIDMNEYKRRQSPPGIKITPRAFGKDRRMPITNKFTEAQYEGYNK